MALSYSFSVTGMELEGRSVDASVERGQRANQSDSIDGTTVTGSVDGGRDTYQFEGAIESIDVPDGVEVRLNGQPVDPDNLANYYQAIGVVEPDDGGGRARSRAALGFLAVGLAAAALSRKR